MVEESAWPVKEGDLSMLNALGISARILEIMSHEQGFQKLCHMKDESNGDV